MGSEQLFSKLVGDYVDIYYRYSRVRLIGKITTVKDQDYIKIRIISSTSNNNSVIGDEIYIRSDTLQYLDIKSIDNSRVVEILYS